MTERQLDGKVAIVTGGSRGIGRAIAERFAAEGARVVVNHVSGSGAADAVVAAIRAAGGEAIAVQADVAKSAEVAALMAATLSHFGRIDILVNNAGVMFTKPMLETTEDEWNQTIATNLTGPYLCSKAVAPIMTGQGAGTIINMSSNSGLYHPSAMRFTSTSCPRPASMA